MQVAELSSLGTSGLVQLRDLGARSILWSTRHSAPVALVAFGVLAASIAWRCTQRNEVSWEAAAYKIIDKPSRLEGLSRAVALVFGVLLFAQRSGLVQSA